MERKNADTIKPDRIPTIDEKYDSLGVEAWWGGISTSRSKIPQPQRVWRQRIKRAFKRKIVEHKVISGIIGWFLLSIFSGLTKSMLDLNGILVKPLSKLANWHPNDQFFGWFEFGVLSVLYLGSALLIWNLIRARSSETSFMLPNILYENELAATAYALDHPDDFDEDSTKALVEDLMYSIAETVATALGVPPKCYRAYFVVTDPENRVAMSGFRIGRQFHLAQKKKMSIQDILEADIEPMDRMCQRTKTVSVMKDVQDEFPKSDIYQMVIIKNPGDFRMGFLVAVLDPKVEIDEHDETFLQVSYIIRSLGFMDKLRDYVLQYE